MPPQILQITTTNAQKRLLWTPYPAAEQYKIFSTTNLTLPFLDDLTGIFSGNSWTAPNFDRVGFHTLQVTPLSSNALLSANLLNRLAYGPTPDDLERVTAIGPQAYLDEQLRPESLANPLDQYLIATTNGVNLPPMANWVSVTVTGTVSSSTFYLYLRGAGDVYIDDIQLRLFTTVVNTNATPPTTNTVLGPNVLTNGDFELPLTPGWNVSANLSASAISAAVQCSGNSSLHLVSSAAGSSQTSSLWQTVTPSLPNNARCVLSFCYVPNPFSKLLTLRLSNSGVITSGADPPSLPSWIYATATGTATANSNLFIYLSGAGEAYIDDIKLVAGTVPEAGPNLLRNGDFETALTGPWQVSADFTNSFIDNTLSHSGNGSLKIVASAAGSGSGDAIFQSNVPGLVNAQTYTVSYWYLPVAQNRTLTVRLSGSLLVSSPDTLPSGLKRRLDNNNREVSLDELRQWFCHNAVGSPSQLLEVLTQFLENHFVTQHSKTSDYFDQYYDGGIRDRIATDLEYREISRWRQALMNPNGTFYDLLKISAESPAMIIYLDTVNSRGDGSQIANENYGRELLELFTLGVDNGYDQNDIVAMSRAWTGWTVDIVEEANLNNPFATRSQQYGYYPGSGFNAVSNIVGVWTFVFNSSRHGTNRAPILSVWDINSPATNPRALGPKIVPARFGPPWAGRSYQLVLPPRTGTNGIQDGYDVIRHLANVPFTMEYMSVKLCRLFVHDDFPNPTTKEGQPEYDFYDYTNPNRSPEAELVRQCLVAWDTPGPDGRKGNMRAVLRTIFNSPLFRSHAGSRQKVKTPLEYIVSSLRSMRSPNPDGTATVFTDGILTSPLSRMGSMSLFNRAEPDGYPESAAPWISAGTLAERLRFVQTLCMSTASGRPSDAGNNTVDPVALLKKKLPSTSWNNADAVADYFVSLFYAGEGRANLDLYRTFAVNFLNTGDDGVTSSPLSVVNNTSTTYDTRIRGMAAMLMTLQRFQEQ